jgi:DNA polymerase-3 subunit epsilon
VVTNPELEVIEEFQLKIKPTHIGNADPVSMKINHYKEEEWKDAIPLEDAMQVFSEKVKDTIMVGQNVAFDSGFIENAFVRLGMKNSMHYHKLDTISIAWAKFHKDIDFEHFSLREMCQHFGIENKHSHTGLGDARATYELYKKLLAL